MVVQCTFVHVVQMKREKEGRKEGRKEGGREKRRGGRGEIKRGRKDEGRT